MSEALLWVLIIGFPLAGSVTCAAALATAWRRCRADEAERAELLDASYTKLEAAQQRHLASLDKLDHSLRDLDRAIQDSHRSAL